MVRCVFELLKTLVMGWGLIFALGFCSPLWAKAFQMNLAGFFASQRIYRGAVTWPKATAMGGPGFIFYRRLKVFGPHLSYDFSGAEGEPEFQLGLRLFDDNPPWLREGDFRGDYRNQRRSTLELGGRVKLKLGKKKRHFVGLFVGRELRRTKGLYAAFSGGMPILPFTSLKAELALAEASTARYLYGPAAKAGWAHGGLEIFVVFPFVPWRGVSFLSFKRDWILEESNQRADYIRGQSANNTFSLRLIWDLPLGG